MRTGRPGGTVPRERGFRPDGKPYQVASRDEVGMITPSVAPGNINQFGPIQLSLYESIRTQPNRQ